MQMANEEKPFGLRPVQGRDGNAWCGKTRGVAVLGTDTNLMGPGDLVKFTGGSVKINDVHYSVITKAVAADVRLAGAIVRFDFDSEGFKSYNPASSGVDRIAHIPQDPGTIYVAQEDADMTLDATESNVDFVVGAVNTATQMSTTALNSATVAATDALPLRVVGMDLSTDNEAGAFALWYVTINQDAYTSKSGIAV